MSKLLSKLRSRSGYTLHEMLVVLALIALFGTAAAAGISAAVYSSKASVSESRFLSVSDTVNAALRGMLADSYYNGMSEDGQVMFICEKYSGWPMSLEVKDGRFTVVIHDRFEGEHTEDLLNPSAYAEFEVSDFEICCLDGIYTCTYALMSDGFSREVNLDISMLNK